MSIETFRLYQTLAEPETAYPTEPSGAISTIEAQVVAAPSVWYVKEVIKPEYATDENNPDITSNDTGKRFNMFALGNGPCLGDRYRSNFGTSRAYLQEGTYLLGWWYNGQLFGVPVTKGDPSGYDDYQEVSVVEEIIEGEVIVPIACTPSGLPTVWQITIDNWPTAALSPYMANRTVTLPLYQDNGREVLYQYTEEDGPDTIRWRVGHYCIGNEGNGGGESVLFGYAKYNTVSGTGISGYSGFWSLANPAAASEYYVFFGGSFPFTTASIIGVKDP